MKSLSVYEEKHSFLNGLSPKSKLMYVISAILLPLLIGGFTGQLLQASFGEYRALASYIPFVVLIVLSFALLATSHVLDKAKTPLGVTGFILLTILIIQTFFRSGEFTPLFSIGPLVTRKEGFELALGIVLNVLNISLSFCVFALTTKPSDMMQQMVQAGFSARLGYVFVSLFQIIPQMTEHTSTIVDAQRSRGMETEGSLLTRIRAFLPLLQPVIMSSFMDTRERSIALEVRGFSSSATKSYIDPFVPNAADTPFFWICVAALVAALACFVIHMMGVMPTPAVGLQSQIFLPSSAHMMGVMPW